MSTTEVRGGPGDFVGMRRGETYVFAEPYILAKSDVLYRVSVAVICEFVEALRQVAKEGQIRLFLMAQFGSSRLKSTKENVELFDQAIDLAGLHAEHDGLYFATFGRRRRRPRVVPNRMPALPAMDLEAVVRMVQDAAENMTDYHPHDLFQFAETRPKLNALLAALADERQARLLVRYYGLDGRERGTLAALAAEFGLSIYGVKELKKRALSNAGRELVRQEQVSRWKRADPESRLRFSIEVLGLPAILEERFRFSRPWITQVRHLTTLSEVDLLAFDGVGPAKVAIIKDALANLGLQLATD